MRCSPVCLKDNKNPSESSYLNITHYHSIVQHIRRSFWFLVFLMSWGNHYLLSSCLDRGILVPFSSLLLFSFVLSVNALLTLLMPYVSGLVLLNRSLSHSQNGVCTCTSALSNCFIKALIHTVTPLFFCDRLL